LIRVSVIAVLFACVPCASAADSNRELQSGTTGWQTVVDGVMGCLSTVRIEAGEGGTPRFTGELSPENNGGISQIRTAVPDGTLEGAALTP
jgi:hypothetical protein